MVSTLKAARLQSLAPQLRELVSRFDSQTTDRELLGRFIADLDADSFAARDAAMKELEKSGRDAESTIRSALLEALSQAGRGWWVRDEATPALRRLTARGK